MDDQTKVFALNRYVKAFDINNWFSRNGCQHVLWNVREIQRIIDSKVRRKWMIFTLPFPQVTMTRPRRRRMPLRTAGMSNPQSRDLSTDSMVGAPTLTPPVLIGYSRLFLFFCLSLSERRWGTGLRVRRPEMDYLALISLHKSKKWPFFPPSTTLEFPGVVGLWTATGVLGGVETCCLCRKLTLVVSYASTVNFPPLHALRKGL